MTGLLLKCAAAFAAVALACGTASAQEYPERGRTLTIIVPFPAGGASDVLGRLVAQKFGELWGVNAIVENKAGGDMLIGMQATANAKKDGYTMGLTTLGFVLNSVVLPKQPVDLFKDFQNVGMVGRSPHVLAVNASSPYKTYKELEAASKANPEKVNYGSCCTGMYFATEMLKSYTALRGTHIPYKGSAPSVQALLANETTFIIDTQQTIKPHADAGKLRALVVTSRKRSSALPDVPTLNEVGVPGDYELEAWWGLVVPQGVPQDVVAKANATLLKILEMPDIKKRMAEFGIDVVSSSPAGMANLIRTDHDRYAKLAREAKLSMKQ